MAKRSKTAAKPIIARDSIPIIGFMANLEIMPTMILSPAIPISAFTKFFICTSFGIYYNKKMPSVKLFFVQDFALYVYRVIVSGGGRKYFPRQKYGIQDEQQYQ